MFQRVLQLLWCVLKDMYGKVSCSRCQDISGSGRVLNLHRKHNVRRKQVLLGKGWTLSFPVLPREFQLRTQTSRKDLSSPFLAASGFNL